MCQFVLEKKQKPFVQNITITIQGTNTTKNVLIYEGCLVSSRSASIIIKQTGRLFKIHSHVIGNFNTFKMICYNNCFNMFVKNNKDIFTNGACIPGHF